MLGAGTVRTGDARARCRTTNAAGGLPPFVRWKIARNDGGNGTPMEATIIRSPIRTRIAILFTFAANVGCGPYTGDVTLRRYPRIGVERPLMLG